MKKARIIIALLVLLGAAPLAEAQIVVSQTTASTTKVYEKSGREKGWVIRPEVGITYIEYSPEGVFLSTQAIIGYQFNPYFTIGGGAGIDNTFCGSRYEAPIYSGIPVFLNARVYFLDRKFSPYFDLKTGYHFSINECVPHYHSDFGGRFYTYKMKGLLASGTIGMQYHYLDFGFTFYYFNSFSTYYENYIEYIQELDQRPDRPNVALMLSFAYNFQLKK